MFALLSVLHGVEQLDDSFGGRGGADLKRSAVRQPFAEPAGAHAMAQPAALPLAGSEPGLTFSFDILRPGRKRNPILIKKEKGER